MTLVYAHRGASARFPEHTRAAYLQAIADGADGVECDVHLTADGEVVLLHDATLDRTSDGTGPVAEHTLAQLRALDFWSWKGVELPPGQTLHEQLLTLDDLLDLLVAAGRPIGLAIEFKHEPGDTEPVLEDATLALLARRDAQLRAAGVEVSFMSFAAPAVAYLLGHVPGGRLCQLVDTTVAQGLDLVDDGRVGIAGPGRDYVAEFPERVRAWLDAGRVLRVWTVDELADLRRCVELGVQEITTNEPAQVRAWLAEA